MRLLRRFLPTILCKRIMFGVYCLVGFLCSALGAYLGSNQHQLFKPHEAGSMKGAFFMGERPLEILPEGIKIRCHVHYKTAVHPHGLRIIAMEGGLEFIKYGFPIHVCSPENELTEALLWYPLRRVWVSPVREPMCVDDGFRVVSRIQMPLSLESGEGRAPISCSGMEHITDSLLVSAEHEVDLPKARYSMNLKVRIPLEVVRHGNKTRDIPVLELCPWWVFVHEEKELLIDRIEFSEGL